MRRQQRLVVRRDARPPCVLEGVLLAAAGHHVVGTECLVHGYRRVVQGLAGDDEAAFEDGRVCRAVCGVGLRH